MLLLYHQFENSPSMIIMVCIYTLWSYINDSLRFKFQKNHHIMPKTFFSFSWIVWKLAISCKPDHGCPNRGIKIRQETIQAVFWELYSTFRLFPIRTGCVRLFPLNLSVLPGIAPWSQIQLPTHKYRTVNHS